MKDHVWAVVCFGFGILAGCTSPRQIASEPKPTLPPVEAFTPEAASLSPQKMCDEWNGKNSHDSGYDMFKSYTSRYDPAVNVCYVRYQTVSGLPPSESDVVYDAFSKRVYAQYLWRDSHPGTPGLDSPPTTCDIRLPGKPDEICKSRKEFDGLTEKYFGLFTKRKKSQTQ